MALTVPRGRELLRVEQLTMRFGGLVAVAGCLSPRGAAA